MGGSPPARFILVGSRFYCIFIHVCELGETDEFVPCKMDRLTPERRSSLMSRVKSKNTKPELAVRRLVFAMGFRYRLHDKRLPGKPDMVFPRMRKIVLVNGCFWHWHEGCRFARLPKSRTEFWAAKLARNRQRDAENLAQLEAAGWRVLTVWQCELKDLNELAERLYGFLDQR